MKKRIISTVMLMAAAISVPLAVSADVKLTVGNFDTASIYWGLSDNGKWAVTSDCPDREGGKVVDLSDNSFVTLTMTNATGGYGAPQDVSDDGNIVVGSYDGMAAMWTRAKGEWTILAYDKNKYGGGQVYQLTPDGKYAVGRLFDKEDLYKEYPAMWDLTTNTFIELEGLPEYDMAMEDKHQHRLNAITNDGRYIAGCVSFSYMGETLYYIYDRQTKTYDPLGFEETPEGFIPTNENLKFLDSIYFSPDGKKATGDAYIVKEIPGSFMANEYTAPYLYDVETKTFEIFDKATDSGYLIMAISNKGNIFAGGNGVSGTPLRNAYVRSGKYWYGIDQIMKANYDMDLTVIDQGLTGTPQGVSGDGRTFISFIDPNLGSSYALTVDKDWDELCEKVDLMGNYYIMPLPGSAMASAYTFDVVFDRAIRQLGETSEIELLDGEGNVVRNAMGLAINANRASISFRRLTLNPSEVYTVVIPAGMFSMAEDTAVKNREVRAQYVGIASEPLAPTIVSPADGSGITQIDYATFNIELGFPAYISLAEDAKAYLYIDDADQTLSAELGLRTTQNVLTVFSTATVPLRRGISYKLVIPAGSVTDLSGAAATANEEIVLHYTGMWQSSSDDRIIYTTDFDSGLPNDMLFYEGDHNTPTSRMAGFGFTADTTPWWIARDDESYDYAAMSHSTYNPSGKSDDWMVTPQLFVPSANVRLEFDAQNYRRRAEDRLSVYVIPSDVVYGALNDEIINKFRADGTLVFNEVLEPGESEESLDGDWTHFEVPLSKFEGKYVYIAFVNENENQSIVFIDNIVVINDMRYQLNITSPLVVVRSESEIIAGTVDVFSEEANYNAIKMTLKDGDGKTIDTIDATGLNVTAEKPFEFSFDKPLPLSIGKINKFTIDIAMTDKGAENAESTVVSAELSDLAFETVKRAVLEEYTGQSCGNCPLGIRGVELIQKDFGDLFIPVVIRSYDNDPESPLNADYAEKIQINGGAPGGVVNRHYYGFPMSEEDGVYTNATGSIENGLWYDFVVAEINDRAIVDFITEKDVEEGDTNYTYASLPPDAGRVTVNAAIRYAVDATDQSVNLFAVLLENDVLCFQENYFCNTSIPILGDWSSGGPLAQNVVAIEYDHLCRNASHTNCIGDPGVLPREFVADTPVSTTLRIAAPSTKIKNRDKLDVVVMLYDNVTGRIANAVKVPVNTSLSVENVIANEGNITIVANGGVVTVNGNGAVAAEVYDLTGRRLAAAQGHDSVEIDMNGYTGVAIVRAADAEGVATAKLVIR